MEGHSRANARESIRVLVIDEHAVVRSGLRFFLSAFDDLELVGEASSAEEASRLSRVRPDVVLMDPEMRGMSGAAATRLIRECWPQTRIIALTTGFKSESLLRGILKAGVTRCLLKNVSAEELVDAIRAAHVGQPTRVLIQAAPQAPAPLHD